jgi:site-specific DNA-cytosine methylase
MAPFGKGGLRPAPYSTMKDVARLAPVIHLGYCVAHCSAGDSVQCQVTPTDLDISGSPCNSWSMDGLRKRHESPWVAATLAWCAWLLAAQIPLAIHENVATFDVSLLQETLGHMYDLFPLRVQPRDAGFGCISRDRLYVVCVLRSALVVSHEIVQLYSQVRGGFSSHFKGTITDLVRASKEELLLEENATRQRRNMAPVKHVSNDWTYLLTPRNREVLAKLSAQWLLCHDGGSRLNRLSI